ncbi:hypothetical protein [Flavobacterium sp. NRK F7]|uniref:hypothetical protein n=1 Tax=Flavobacterium sp. NRK F7 TaxID=2954930 RepID=UPI002091A3A6|nr:hypothetical protein [Flavobacterium sp. NRK F7]MCO6164546.1 hypothetical protein [Flavobacterium sp. NRK F7]
MKFLKGYLFLFLISSFISFSQVDTIYRAPNVYAKGKVSKNKILLKWSVDNPVLWKKSLNTGYKLERTTVLRDGNPIMKDEVVTLEEKLLPLPLPEWEALAQQDSLVLVVAQAIYGDDFQVERNDNSLNSMMLLNDENNQRFAFSMMTAEQSFLATKAAGWGYEDKTAQANEKYVYTITLLGVDGNLHASVYIGLQDKEDATPPLAPEAIFGNKTVMIVWDFASQQNLYSSYHLERSVDNSNFKRLNDYPIFSWESNSKIISYTDHLEDNNTTYYYRILGVDTFGETSLPSTTISGKGINLLEYTPQIVAKGVIAENKVSIEWTFPEEGEFKISGFNVLQGETENGQFQLVKQNLQSNTRKDLVETKLKPSNYFKIQAVAKEGGSRESFPVLIQPIDSIPPVAPIDLEGEIDSLGVVNLKWKQNIESDLKGYKVFRGYDPKEEFVQITKAIWLQNTYRDSINSKSLNKKVYYKVIAIDQRYNESNFSKIVEIKKIDIIPPSSPVIKNYSFEENKITLDFIPSSSDDVMKHFVYRRTENEEDWQLIQEIEGKKTTRFTDTNVKPKTEYYYTITAVDDSENESDPAEPLIASPLLQIVKPAIKSFDYIVDRNNRVIELYWSSKEKDIYEYQLYKKSKEGSYILYKIIEPRKEKMNFIDSNINPGNVYNYSIRAVFKDGSLSAFKEIKVTY